MLLPTSASAQLVSLTIGPADLHDAAGAGRPPGVAGSLGFERARKASGVTWRAEFAVASFAAPDALREEEGPLRQLALVAHALYVVPRPIVTPYVGIGAGPIVRELGSPSEAPTRVGGAVAVTAGVRLGPGWRRVLFEARSGATAAGAVPRATRVQRWSQLVVGGSFDFGAADLSGS